MNKRYFVTGIGTGVGKTLVSALLCEHLKADYFKPVQTGYPPDRDSEWVKNMVSYPIRIHPEKYLLQLPASPHIAAKRENVEINIHVIQPPPASNTLIIEGAGGLLVPLNNTHYIADLIGHLNAECILVINNYLGCINHSLLSLYYIEKEKIPLKGVVLNGDFEQEVKDSIIQNISEKLVISHIPYVKQLDKSMFHQVYRQFTENLKVAL